MVTRVGVVGFRVLGSLEVETGGRVLDLGGPRLRALLALLVASAGHAVSVPALVEALWRENAPDDAHRTVRTYVSRLRKATRRAVPGPVGAVLVTRVPVGSGPAQFRKDRRGDLPGPGRPGRTYQAASLRGGSRLTGLSGSRRIGKETDFR